MRGSWHDTLPARARPPALPSDPAVTCPVDWGSPRGVLVLIRNAPPKLAICISVFRPDRALLSGLLAALDREWPVILCIDGPTGTAIEPEDLAILESDPRGYRILQSPRNLGIGTSLNRMAREAAQLGCEWVLFFDQDSAPPSDLPAQLLIAFARLNEAGHRPAVIGPAPVAAEGGQSKAPSYHPRAIPSPSSRYRAVDFVITSGSLIQLSSFGEIGRFRQEFRMDAIDVEWCFRAWAAGYSVWQVNDLKMLHRVGDGVIQFGPVRFPQQSRSRMQSYVRSQFHLLRLAHIPLRWKLRTLVYVPLQIALFVASSRGRRIALGGTLLQAAMHGLAGTWDKQSERHRDEP